MALHIHVYNRDSDERNDDGSLKTVFERRAENSAEAMGFISSLKVIIGFTKKSWDEMYDVVKAAKTEYVGVEHELMLDLQKWSPWGISIEGQFGKETFDERIRDIRVNSLVIGADRKVEYYGEDSRGNKVWGILHVVREAKIKVVFPSEYDNS